MAKHLLTDILSLDELDVDLYRGYTPANNTFPRIFGGQTVSQSLMAASKTVNENLRIHSLHSYFLRPGDVQIPIIYTVDRTRDGTSFSTRNVIARQKGKAIFSMSVSFQVPESGGYQHAAKMPVVPEPDTIDSRETSMMKMADDDRLPEFLKKLIRKQLGVPFPCDLRSIQRRDPFHPVEMDAKQQVWMKVRDVLGDDPHLNESCAAYLSDFSFLETALYPHAAHPASGSVQMASLDHSMWFHSPFRADEWMLFDMISPRAVGSRGFVTGNIFTRDGTLAISCAQEGLIRKMDVSSGSQESTSVNSKVNEYVKKRAVTSKM